MPRGESPGVRRKRHAVAGMPDDRTTGDGKQVVLAHVDEGGEEQECDSDDGVV